MKRVLFSLLSVALLAGAGCLDSGSDGSDVGDGDGDGTIPPQRYALPEDPMPEGADHDHTDPAQHKFLWNYDFSARDPLMQNQANTAGVHALDLQGGYLFGAVYGSHSASVDGGLVIWDLSDPTMPVETGRWTIPGSVGGDRSMEATQDGNYAVITTEPVDCLGHINPGGAAASAYLIDTRDKSLPVVADVVTVTGQSRGDPGRPTEDPTSPSVVAGYHSAAVHNIGGEDYAFLFGDIYRIDRTEQGATLDFLTSVQVGHDMYIRDTPWGDTWMLTAQGSASGGGLTVYDVSDPSDPKTIGIWAPGDGDPTFGSHYFHTADVAFLDGQIVIIISSEDWQDHISPMWILDGNPLRDATEETQLHSMGSWHNPGNHTALGVSFSLHNPRFSEDGILTISSYHGGLWQLDLRTPEFWADPAPIAYAVYAEDDAPLTKDPVESAVERNLCGLGTELDTPTYMDVELGEGGILYAADVYMGLYTFTPTAEHPVYGGMGVAGTDDGMT